jgi:hypothetical protein
MSSEDKLRADGNAPATLVDGDNSTNYYTLGEAVIAREHLPEERKNAAKIKSEGRVFISGEIDRLHHEPPQTSRPTTRALRVLVALQNLPSADGRGEVALTYQCARPTTRQVGAITAPDTENYFEAEKLPYKTDEEGEELMRHRRRYLRKL